MNTEQSKQRLVEEKLKLESEMGKIGRKNPAVPNDWEPISGEVEEEADPIDQAELVTELETSSAIFADLEARYDSVLAALARIEKGTYGICEVCGAPVEEARLAVDPAAPTCIEHK